MAFRKDDAGKPRMSLLPHEALMGAAEVMTYGAQKYDDHNWRQATEWSRYYDATMRHLMDWQMGKEVDDGPKGSGLATIDHAVCSLLMLSSLIKTGVGTDDRYGTSGTTSYQAPASPRRAKPRPAEPVVRGKGQRRKSRGA